MKMSRCSLRGGASTSTRGALLGNLAVYAQSVVLLGQMQDQLLSCSETGEGLAYGDFPCFQQVMAKDSGQPVVAQLFDVVLPLAKGITMLSQWYRRLT